MAVEEPHHALLVLLGPRGDAADVAAARHFPDRLRVAGGLVVGRVEVALAVLSMLAVDEENRSRGDLADEVLEARRRSVIREECDSRRERAVRRQGEPFVV